MVKALSWHETNLRWFVLCLIGVYPLAQFLIAEFPALLGEQIKNYFQVTQEDVNYLLLFESLPNMIMTLVGGLIIDAFGVRRSYVLFGIVVILGQFLCLISVFLQSFKLMIIGRFVFGIFESSGCVAESYYINKWFKDKENSFAYGIDTALCRIGSITASILYPFLYSASDNDLSRCLLMCLKIAIFSFITILILTQIDRFSDMRDKVEDQKLESIDLRQIKNFSLEFYITLISCATCYSVFFIFSYNSVEMFKQNFKLDQNTANILFSIPYYLSALLSPIVGYYLQRIGRNIEILIIACSCQLLTLTMFQMLPEFDSPCLIFPLIGSILNGLFFGIYFAVMWPYIPNIVPSHMVATGFGLIYSCINLELTCFSYIVANILRVENYENYLKMNSLLLLLSFIGFISLIYLLFSNQSKQRNSNHSQSNETDSTIQIELMVLCKQT
ncbi:unnamed protein product [Paramecium pentaurelia]|uniref:Major facilitator superfamily (MFS) profile domain-containing protein n=1 Tax=Paramecium pentaurelia TaxID=43138 RepID=A0A8S1XKW0_9CILI|nr:unnamed protein product [Paramecium pentaurelia]